LLRLERGGHVGDDGRRAARVDRRSGRVVHAHVEGFVERGARNGEGAYGRAQYKICTGSRGKVPVGATHFEPTARWRIDSRIDLQGTGSGADYGQLDEILERHVEKCESAEEIIAEGQKQNDAFADYSFAVTQGGSSVLMDALKEVGRGTWFSVLERSRIGDLLQERQIIRANREENVGPDGRRLPPLGPLLNAGIILEGGIIGYDTNILTGGFGIFSSARSITSVSRIPR